MEKTGKAVKRQEEDKQEKERNTVKRKSRKSRKAREESREKHWEQQGKEMGKAGGGVGGGEAERWEKDRKAKGGKSREAGRMVGMESREGEREAVTKDRNSEEGEKAM